MAAQFIWYELMTTDLQQSAAFFAGLLDCDVLQTAEPPSFFLAPKGTEAPLFGMVPVQVAAGMRSHWIGYLMVDDFDEAMRLTQEAGGTVHATSEDAEGRGADLPRFAIVTDAQGAVVNLHERVDGTPASEDMPGLGRLAWTELLTTNREAAAGFYQSLAGWEVGPAHERPEEGIAHALFRDTRVFGLLRDLPAGSPVPPSWTFYLRVPDLDAAIAHAKLLGGFMYEDPAAVDGGRRVLMLDPTGAPVALWASL